MPTDKEIIGSFGIFIGRDSKYNPLASEKIKMAFLPCSSCATLSYHAPHAQEPFYRAPCVQHSPTMLPMQRSLSTVLLVHSNPLPRTETTSSSPCRAPFGILPWAGTLLPWTRSAIGCLPQIGILEGGFRKRGAR